VIAPALAAPRRTAAHTLWQAVALPLLALIAWQLWAFTLPPDTRAPYPTKVLTTFYALTASGDLPMALLQSLARVVSGFAAAMLLGGVLGVLMGSSRVLRENLDPLIESFRPIAPMAVLPIAILWFGTGTPAALAIVAYAAFFPVLVNTVARLAASERMQRDLMATWGASYWQTLFKLRLPAAMPFIFNGLKIATTLALIGAIVAEFFGSPTRGMGFRISTAVGQLALDMVWAEIVVAALAGSLSYGLVALIEKAVTFWHPSQRGRT